MALELFCIYIFSSCIRDKEDDDPTPSHHSPSRHTEPRHTAKTPPLKFAGYSSMFSMSSQAPASVVPKASRSTVKNLTVEPDKWDFYPTIERSTVENCKFTNLHETTKIERSTLKEVTLHSLNSPITIERSTIAGGTLSSAKCVERSELVGCDVGKGASFNRSKCIKSIVSNGASVERSTLKHCLVADASCIERSELVDCEVVSCKLSRTKMQGMLLRNGVWDRNDLVGRVNQHEEVICRPIDHKFDPMPQQLNVVLVPGTAPAPGAAVNEGPASPVRSESMQSDSRRADWVQGHSRNQRNSLGPNDNAQPVAEASNSSEMQIYEGPRVDSPPPPYESLDVDERSVAENSERERKGKS